MTTLVSRNVTVAGHRTSMRLEPAMWDAVAEICRRERQTLHDLCTVIEAQQRASSLTAALRVFILDYYRTAATEDGHSRVGHGIQAPRAVDPFASAALHAEPEPLAGDGPLIARVSLAR